MNDYLKLISLLSLSFFLVACSRPDNTDENTHISTPLPDENKKSLNLSVNDLPASENSDDADFSKRKHELPDMFDKKLKQRKTTLSAGVLREEENPDYVDSIHGAEVSVEIKIP